MRALVFVPLYVSHLCLLYLFVHDMYSYILLLIYKKKKNIVNLVITDLPPPYYLYNHPLHIHYHHPLHPCPCPRSMGWTLLT